MAMMGLKIGIGHASGTPQSPSPAMLRPAVEVLSDKLAYIFLI